MSSDPPVITVTPTIHSGTVVRWYRSAGAAKYRGEVISASRYGVVIHGDVFLHDIPEEWIGAAKQAHAELAGGNAEGISARNDLLSAAIRIRKTVRDSSGADGTADVLHLSPHIPKVCGDRGTVQSRDWPPGTVGEASNE